ncbi:hypothetical protein CJ030_MR0G002897 [Morella rubra]|uniref:Uncharacterized protein n=1 Tax=Morella rubra TaxID=262757 RepID=A0A6A1UR77_9ROSI|nr:hypothetical protein CJ030_MR0G002897 [Morella rubra]
MVRIKHATEKGKEKVGTSRKRKELLEGDNSSNFRDDECASKYEDDFSRRKGWKNLLDMGKNVYPKYVRMFFSNMKISKHVGGSLTIKSLLHRKEVELDPAKLGRILGIPCDAQPVYDLKKVPRALDFRHIADVHEHKKNLPCGLIFTKILTYFGIPKDMRVLEIVTHIDPFNMRTLRKMGYKKNTNGEWIWRDDSSNDEGEEGDEDAAVPPSSSTHGETSESYIDRQHSVDARINTLELDLTSLRKEQQEYVKEVRQDRKEQQL